MKKTKSIRAEIIRHYSLGFVNCYKFVIWYLCSFDSLKES